MLEKRTFAPPVMGRPPSTREIRIWVSSWLPAVAVMEPTLMTLTNAARPVSAPAQTKARNFTRSVCTPEKRAAVSPAPTAFTSLPMRVNLNRNQPTISTATVMPIFRPLLSMALMAALAGTAVSVVK